MKDCFGLHGHSAFGSVAKRQIGVGQQSLLSQVQLTDPSHWLQAGKTVDILRCAAESTDLLPPSALLRPLRGLQLPRPPALRLADYRCQSANADLPPARFPNPCRLRRHPLPGELPASRPVAPVIVLPLWFFVFVGVVVLMSVTDFNQKGSACTIVLLLYVLLYYMGRRHNASLVYMVLVLLGIWRLLMIPA